MQSKGSWSLVNEYNFAVRTVVFSVNRYVGNQTFVYRWRNRQLYIVNTYAHSKYHKRAETRYLTKNAKHIRITGIVLLTYRPVDWKIVEQSSIHDDLSWWTTDFLAVEENTLLEYHEVATPNFGEVVTVIGHPGITADNHGISYGFRTPPGVLLETMWGLSWYNNQGNNSLC